MGIGRRNEKGLELVRGFAQQDEVVIKKQGALSRQGGCS
jgi:hypothetical protein